MPLRVIKQFLKLESSAGILLVLATFLALVAKNSSFEYLYDAFLHTPVVLQVGEFLINKPLLLWINDGLMIIFFLLVGLEIKREVLEGELSSVDTISLPAIAAAGGLIVPAIIYAYINWNDAVAVNGWAIPAATDIAFALGVVTLLGDRVPMQLKVLLLAIATMDDLAAIVIIAVFYTSSLSFLSLGLAVLGVIGLFILNNRGVVNQAPYMLVGVFLWACVLKSGVHATLAGVIIALFIPHKTTKPHGKSLLSELEDKLHPWVAYAVLPIFAFTNAGVSLKGLSLEIFTNTITLGIILGLFFGKQIGVMLFSGIAIQTGFCRLPQGTSWIQYYGISIVTGIGFTMSLFIGSLVFDNVQQMTYMRIGAITASILSATIGALVLLLSTKNKA